MGQIYNAHCECGYCAEALTDRGFDGIYFAPFYCTDCHRLVNERIDSEPLKCHRCGSTFVIPYDSPQMPHRIVKLPVGAFVAQSDRFPSSRFRYFCPNCQQTTLHFSGCGHWD